VLAERQQNTGSKIRPTPTGREDEGDVIGGTEYTFTVRGPIQAQRGSTLDSDAPLQGRTGITGRKTVVRGGTAREG
jgi:hypothetical protein